MVDLGNHTDIALSFDDILIDPGRTSFDIKEVSLRTKLTKKIEMNIPAISSPMDYVTEYKMAIAMAQNGGFGIIHSYLPIDTQVDQVKKVKRAESFVIRDVYTISPEQTIEDLKKMMEEKNVSAFPVVLEDKLLGLMTKRDVKNLDNSLRIEEAMTTRLNPREGKSDRRLITAKDGIDRKAAETILYDNKIEKLPVVDDNNFLKGLITETDISKRQNFPYATRDSEDRLMVGAAVNVEKNPSKNLDRIEALYKAGLDVLCIDAAHGHSSVVGDLLNTVKSKYENLEIIAGNVITSEGAEFLCEMGADAIRVGFGCGSGCTTRIGTGIGKPQVSAIKDCYEVTNKSKYKVPIIADGGFKYQYYGHCVIALGFGASSCMFGGLLAGTDESPSPEELIEGTRYKKYRGMGSVGALRRRFGVGRYPEAQGMIYEGVETEVSYKGTVAKVVGEFVGGVRKGMWYAGVKNIDELRNKISNGGFSILTTAAQKEGYHP